MGRDRKKRGGIGRGREGQGEVGRDRERWGGAGRGGEGQGEVQSNED